MFDIGWTEMLVIAVVMIVVVGPKDLPKMLRTFGKTTTKLRSMAGDFQKQFNEALKEAELDDVKKSVDALRGLNPANEIKKQLNPFEKAAADVRAGLDKALKPSTPAATAAAAPATAEPLKNGRTDLRLRRGCACADRSPGPAGCRLRRRLFPTPEAAPAPASAPVTAAPAPAKAEAAAPAKRAAPAKKSYREDGDDRRAGRARTQEEDGKHDVSGNEVDEIDKSSAPLIEHLIELRSRLMWAIGGFFVAFLVCFFFAKQLFNLLVIPFKWAVAWAGDPTRSS
jgi:sec-independent protein translocase protein TatB